eukprot:6189938-Prymnesium_polylepis.3
MPCELISHLSGHATAGGSALQEYIDPSRALAIPGAQVLAGHPALPWAQLGEGPRPPTLEALEELGVDVEELEGTMDTLFHLDSAAPPMLLRGGKLRPMIHTAFASMLMYHQERLDSGEMREVVVMLRGADGAQLHPRVGGADPRALRR